MIDPATGMALGSALAGLVGGGMSAFGKKSPAQTTQLPTKSPEQMGWMGQLGQQGMANVDPEALEKRSMKMFQQQIMPSIAERFAGMGALDSTGFEKSMMGASGELLEGLQGQRSGLGLQQLMMALQPQFENMYRPEGPGAMQSFGGNLMGAGLQALGPSLGLMGSQMQQRGQAKESDKWRDFFKQSQQRGIASKEGELGNEIEQTTQGYEAQLSALRNLLGNQQDQGVAFGLRNIGRMF